MFSLRRPTQSILRRKLEQARNLPGSYGIALNTQCGPEELHVPKGYVRDHTRSEIGRGSLAFKAAREAFSLWQHFDLGWVRVANPEAKIEQEEIVADVIPGVPGLALGLAAGSVSAVNDPSKLNLSTNLTGGALGVTSFLMEGTAIGATATVGGVGVAVGAMAWDGSSFVSNNVITPVFTPDANQSNTINANGVTIPAPDAYDWHQP